MASHLKSNNQACRRGLKKRFRRVGKFAKPLSLALATTTVFFLFCLVLGCDFAEAAAHKSVMQDQGATVETQSRLRLKTDLAKPDSIQSAQATQGLSAASTPFRDVPSVSGQYSVGRTSLMPYIGAGFRGGYASDLDRALAPSVVTPSDFVLRSQFGQGLTPNEFQMGIRIPF